MSRLRAIDGAAAFLYLGTIMKLLLPLFLLAACAMAAEPVQLPLDVGTLKMTDGRLYEGVKVVGQDAVGLKITHEGGTARIPFEKLPKSLADRFPRDPEAAKKQKEEEAKAEAAHERAMEKAVPADKKGTADKGSIADEGDENGGSVEKEPELSGDAKAKIAALKTYVARLEKGITEAQGEVDKSRQRASDLRADANYAIVTTYSDGTVTRDDRTNNSKLAKARYHDNRARNYETKIKEAQALIDAAKAKLGKLEKP